ncbi:T9SS type A sorting domain-containing protein [Cesiribacter sp. SM1]|uniref:T9SS type A sorting domain-containing protein n=1 Tax=Cesiribacter sp. SM1 TaxID=2861196 RepID=UPI001CD674E2|nr:T9SS type A sorting domain-containing protein [Cesiribacter sp. SM1]
MKNQFLYPMMALACLIIFSGTPIFAQAGSAADTNLPLAVLELTARNQDKLIVVEWTSIDEAGLSQYLLQYSADGKTYKDLVRVPSRGSVNDAAFVYTITDYPVEREYHYYRLLAVPQTGEPEEKAGIRIGRSGTLTTTIHPNPAKADRFPTVIPSDQAYQILLCDASGNVIKEYQQRKKTHLLIPIRDIQEGLHLLRVYKQQQ